MALGYRNEGIAILGTEVMAPRGLVGLAFDTITHSTSEFAQIFRLLCDSANYPMLVHCTQGKDRTGLVVIFLLLLCDIPLDAISADFRASERELVSEREERIKDMAEIGLGEDFANCPTDFVQSVKDFIAEKYGGVEGYMNGIGVDETMRQSIKQNLLV
ncbi:hypothetical protein MMC20_002885 [Loxospora ochrophaea]|nr:hypothetical protein [Loxospora ochrophaea]